VGRALWIALWLVLLASCGNDPLFKDRHPDGGGLTLDAGSVEMDAGSSDAASGGDHKLVWARVPSSGAILGAEPGSARTIRVRMPPPDSIGQSSSPEHRVRTVLGGGGTR
jgi:hypothetical protein